MPIANTSFEPQTAPGSLRWRKFVAARQGNASPPAAVIAVVGVA